MSQTEMELDSVRRATLKDEWVVLLKEKRGDRYLHIYVGSTQANVIKRALEDKPFSESEGDSCGLPHIATILPMTESALVTIMRFEGCTFIAELLINYRSRSYQVELPVAKAMALGLRARAHFYTDDLVLDKAGVTAI